MSVKLSVTEILANLEAQMAFHQQQEAHHAEREGFHRDQRAVHAAEYASVAQHYEAFKATAGAAAEIAARTLPAATQEEEIPPGTRVIRSRLLARVMADIPPGQPFGARQLVAEVNRRFGKSLRKPANFPLASAALRRMLANGKIRLVREGAAHREALYAKE